MFYSEELLPSPPPQVVIKPYKCSFCRMQDKMERVILTGRSHRYLQLLISTGHARSQAVQLGHGQHSMITAGMRKPGQNMSMQADRYLLKHGHVSTDARGFLFSPLPHGDFLCYGHGSAHRVPVELAHPFHRGRASEMC